jgi:hypothetical protein
VSLGPFPDYRSSVGRLMGSAAELWEFSDPNSEVSKRLESAVKIVLAYGARVTYIGSMDDQLVPLEVCRGSGKSVKENNSNSISSSLPSMRLPIIHIYSAQFSLTAGSMPLICWSSFPTLKNDHNSF